MDVLVNGTLIAQGEVVVVDNNSSDDTREVVAEMAHEFPVEMRYLFEGEQGKPAALNSGMAIAHGDVIAFTDDDHRFEPDWLAQAEAGLNRFNCDYVGGKILPLFEGPVPRWRDALADRAERLRDLSIRQCLGLTFGAVVLMLALLAWLEAR